MSGIGFLLVGFKFGLGVFLNKGSYAIENKFDVLKASLDSSALHAGHNHETIINHLGLL